ncbi:MAG: hypothetical protein K2P69_14810 [Eubacterium sp.]|nr:hypothetical protein [Eubacterium sp.]
MQEIVCSYFAKENDNYQWIVPKQRDFSFYSAPYARIKNVRQHANQSCTGEM